MKLKKLLALLLALMMVFSLAACGTGNNPPDDGSEGGYTDDSGSGDSGNADGSGSGDSGNADSSDPPLDENGFYYSAKDVGLYLHQYGKLPSNFITKSDARKLGWNGGSVEKYKPGYAIGGDSFGNREGLLPKASGRKYYECDIDTNGGKARGAKRIVYSNDGLIYYTDDHYESFTLLYGGASQ